MKTYISYKDDDKEETIITGYFQVVEQNSQYIKIKSNKNFIIIPYHRILKIKFNNDKGGNNKKIRC